MMRVAKVHVVERSLATHQVESQSMRQLVMLRMGLLVLRTIVKQRSFIEESFPILWLAAKASHLQLSDIENKGTCIMHLQTKYQAQ